MGGLRAGRCSACSTPTRSLPCSTPSLLSSCLRWTRCPLCLHPVSCCFSLCLTLITMLSTRHPNVGLFCLLEQKCAGGCKRGHCLSHHHVLPGQGRLPCTRARAADTHADPRHGPRRQPRRPRAPRVRTLLSLCLYMYVYVCVFLLLSVCVCTLMLRASWFNSHYEKRISDLVEDLFAIADADKVLLLMSVPSVSAHACPPLIGWNADIR